MAENEHPFTCPVCEYSRLRYNPAEGLHEICPQCGTQFGYSDAGPEPASVYHARLRERWVAAGRSWHSRVVKPDDRQ
jgi:hypothetical protein